MNAQALARLRPADLAAGLADGTFASLIIGTG